MNGTSRIGRLVRETRSMLGLSQVALAAAAGVSLPTVQNVEAGRANPALSTLRSLLAPLGLSVEVGTQPADWDALSAHGLPIRESRRKGTRVDGDSLARHVRLASLELLRDPRTPGAARRRESLRALLLAIKGHYPSFFRSRFGRSPVIGSLLPEEPSGREVKLARIARAALARYL